MLIPIRADKRQQPFNNRPFLDVTGLNLEQTNEMPICCIVVDPKFAVYPGFMQTATRDAFGRLVDADGKNSDPCLREQIIYP